VGFEDGVVDPVRLVDKGVISPSAAFTGPADFVVPDGRRRTPAPGLPCPTSLGAPAIVPARVARPLVCRGPGLSAAGFAHHGAPPAESPLTDDRGAFPFCAFGTGLGIWLPRIWGFDSYRAPPTIEGYVHCPQRKDRRWTAPRNCGTAGQPDAALVGAHYTMV
jgi:hypothetical protein